VHADLSEYNMLYFLGELFVIDVSQAVEHDHPHALDFLRRDVDNVSEFFSRRGIAVASSRCTFDFIVDPTPPPEEDAPAAARLVAASRGPPQSVAEEIEATVFRVGGGLLRLTRLRTLLSRET
jgi:RIO kinase 1